MFLSRTNKVIFIVLSRNRKSLSLFFFIFNFILCFLNMSFCINVIIFQSLIDSAKEVHNRNNITGNQAMGILHSAKDAYSAAKKASDVRSFTNISTFLLPSLCLPLFSASLFLKDCP